MILHAFQQADLGEVVFYQKSKGLSLTINQTEVFSFDVSGRLYSVFQEGVFYQRSLGNQLLKKHRQGTTLLRELMSASERNELYQGWFARLERVYGCLHAQDLAPDVLNIYQRLLAFDPVRLSAEEAHFESVYQPISILPPDQYTAIVLQLTEGCSYNRCHFCNFYKGRRFKIKSPSEFDTHIQKVKALLGDGALYRQRLFLADGDALMVPQERLLACLDILRKHYPERPLYSFMDAFRPQSKSMEDYQALQARGLKRVYFGIETGDPELLSFLGKPGSPELMRQEINKLKAAGVSVGLIFMVGVGGEQYKEQHFQQSVDLLRKMTLDTDDILFLSEFINHPDQPYAEYAHNQQIQDLSPEALQAEVKRWRRACKTLPAQVSTYHLKEFIY